MTEEKKESKEENKREERIVPIQSEPILKMLSKNDIEKMFNKDERRKEKR